MPLDSGMTRPAWGGLEPEQEKYYQTTDLAWSGPQIFRTWRSVEFSFDSYTIYYGYPTGWKYVWRCSKIIWTPFWYLIINYFSGSSWVWEFCECSFNLSRRAWSQPTLLWSWRWYNDRLLPIWKTQELDNTFKGRFHHRYWQQWYWYRYKYTKNWRYDLGTIFTR